MHTQSFFELNIILEGEGMHYIENQKLPVQRGDVFIIPPNIKHGYHAISDFDVCHILMSQGFFERYAGELKALPMFFLLFNIEPIMRTVGNSSLYLKISEENFIHINYLLEQLIIWSASSNLADVVLCNY